MTYKEAKEYMENLRIDLYDEIHEGIAKQVREKCIEALGKQIPKKPNSIGKYYDPSCPTCGRRFFDDQYNFCPRCSQAIGWRF